GCDPAGRDRAMAQRPQERLIPRLAKFLGFHVRERARDPLVRVVHRSVDGRAVLCDQTIFLIPDVVRRFLERNTADIFGLYFDHAIHGYLKRSLIIMARHSKTSGGGPDEQGTPCERLKLQGDYRKPKTTTYCVRSERVRLHRDQRQDFFMLIFSQKNQYIS